MKVIKDLVDHISDELCDAKKYAECYVAAKAKNNPQNANKYKDMSADELRHAMYLHDIAVQEIEELRSVFTPPQEMQEIWDKSHIEYVEKTSWIKQMLSL